MSSCSKGQVSTDVSSVLSLQVDLEFDLAESLQALNAFFPSKLCSCIQQMTIFSGFTETRFHSFKTFDAFSPSTLAHRDLIEGVVSFKFFGIVASQFCA
jgi:hypothetical protein